MQPQTATHVADGSTWLTYALAAGAALFAWLDAHASGLMAVAAIITAGVNWYYRHKGAKWDGVERRRESRD